MQKLLKEQHKRIYIIPGYPLLTDSYKDSTEQLQKKVWSNLCYLSTIIYCN